MTKAGRFDKLCRMTKKQKQKVSTGKAIRTFLFGNKWIVWAFLFYVGAVLLFENAPVFIVATIFGWYLHKNYEIRFDKVKKN